MLTPRSELRKEIGAGRIYSAEIGCEFLHRGPSNEYLWKIRRISARNVTKRGKKGGVVAIIRLFTCSREEREIKDILIFGGLGKYSIKREAKQRACVPLFLSHLLATPAIMSASPKADEPAVEKPADDQHEEDQVQDADEPGSHHPPYRDHRRL